MKTALITGSSNGIGAAIAEKLAANGIKVFLTGRNEGRLKEQALKCNNANFMAIDLLEANATNKLFEAAINELKQIDILVNNAGTYEWAPIDRPVSIETTLKLNVQVPFELCYLLVPNMKKQKWGRIINIGSISGIVGEPNASLYSMSKASLIGLTKSLALELAEYGITSNLINPGWVKTFLVEKEINNGKLNPTEEIETVPQKRWIEPYEIADMASYLCSDSAVGITGQSINICGGLSLG